MTDDSELETHDIYLAAYLNFAGCVMKRRRRQGSRVYLIFTNPAGSINLLREEYYSGKAIVKAHSYAKEIIAMKELVNGPL